MGEQEENSALCPHLLGASGQLRNTISSIINNVWCVCCQQNENTTFVQFKKKTAMTLNYLQMFKE